VWDTDANANYVSDPIGMVSGDSYALEALEPSFQQDLNGDGTIGPTTTVIQTLDGTTLVELGAVSAEYAMENSGGSGPTLSNGGGQCGRRRRAPGGRRLRRRNWRRAAIRSPGGIARPAVIRCGTPTPMAITSASPSDRCQAPA
jgi:hypothetical protein